MSLKKSNIAFTILSILILIIASMSFLFPDVTDSVITGFASIAGFPVAVTVTTGPSVPVVTPPAGGGGGGGGALTDYAPAKGFIVEPDYINMTAPYVNITTSIHGRLRRYINIYNLREDEEQFSIKFTKNFIYTVEGAVPFTANPGLSIPSGEFAKISIYIDTTYLEPGTYTDFIHVSDGTDEETVTFKLELLEMPAVLKEEVPKLPEEEKPVPIEKERIVIEPSDVLPTILWMIGLVLIMAAIVFLYFRRRKIKTIKY